MTKQRIDQLLVERGMFMTREQAKRSVMAGLVYSETMRIDKPGQMVQVDAPLEVKGTVHPFVSRGGLKLAKALEVFKLDVTGKVALDIGASTGGFTDCLLQNGAALVYAIDVGYGQLDWKLRNDPRVIVMERTNIRYVTKDDLSVLGQLATIDVAFISLTKFFASLLDLLEEDAEIVALIKPQFEVGREHVGKKGVVRDLDIHIELLQTLIPQLQSYGCGLINLDYSPIRGPEGNIEYLAHFGKTAPVQDVGELAVLVVNGARTMLD